MTIDALSIVESKKSKLLKTTRVDKEIFKLMYLGFSLLNRKKGNEVK